MIELHDRTRKIKLNIKNHHKIPKNFERIIKKKFAIIG